MGLLKIEGYIRLDQFWPKGKSEADSSTIKIVVNNNSFQYSQNGTDGFEAIPVFDEACITTGRKKQKLLRRGNQVLVKLAGADAPELHYKLAGPTPVKHPTKRGNLSRLDYERLIQINNSVEFRQPLAETCMIMLLGFLSKFGRGRIHCTFTAHAGKPADVCDAQGRFVGNIFVEYRNKPLSLNLWMLENGWAFPAFYNNMTREEIGAALKATKAGMNAKNALYQYYREYLGIFDFNLRFRPPSGLIMSPKPMDDKGHLVYPKLFRRWCIYNVYKHVKIDIGTFSDYLKACGDEFYDTGDFLAGEEVKSQPLHEIVKGNRLTKQPWEIIFIKKPVKLIDVEGKEITDWGIAKLQPAQM